MCVGLRASCVCVCCGLYSQELYCVIGMTELRNRNLNSPPISLYCFSHSQVQFIHSLDLTPTIIPATGCYTWYQIPRFSAAFPQCDSPIVRL